MAFKRSQNSPGSLCEPRLYRLLKNRRSAAAPLSGLRLFKNSPKNSINISFKELLIHIKDEFAAEKIFMRLIVRNDLFF